MAEAMDLVVNPIANVLRSVGPPVETKSVFYALYIISFVAASIWPDLESTTVLLISKPLSFVNSATLMPEFAVSVSFA